MPLVATMTALIVCSCFLPHQKQRRPGRLKYLFRHFQSVEAEFLIDHFSHAGFPVMEAGRQ